MKYDFLNRKQNCLLLMLWCSCINGYAQDILWEKSYGGSFAEYLLDTQPTADYGFILAGSSVSEKTGNKSESNNGNLDYWVWKMTENGALDWQKTIGGSGNDLLTSLKNTQDGGFILAGTSSSNAGFQKKENCKGISDYWVIKLDAIGNEQWQRTIGGSGQDELLSVIQTRDGGYLLGGSSSSSPKVIEFDNETILKPDLYIKSEKSRGNMDYWIVKLDRNGIIQWQKTYGGDYADLLRSMEQTKDGGYIVGGYSNSPQSGEKTDDNSGIGDFWIIKINDEGTIEWQKTYGGNQDEQLYAIHQTKDGGYIVGGNSNSTDSLSSLGGIVKNGTDYWIFKMDLNGTIVWSITYDFGAVDILTSLVENEDHTYLVGGYSSTSLFEEENQTTKTQEGIDDYISLIISENGEVLSSKTVGSNGQDILKKLIATRDGGYLMTGSSNPQSTTTTSTARKMKNGKQNEQLQNGINRVNNIIHDAEIQVNNSIKDALTDATDALNNAVNKDSGSRFKLGFNTPTGSISLPTLGSGNNSKASKTSKEGKEHNQKKLPASRDKKTNYGGNDFWVVKLKDTHKPLKPKTVHIEAMPNPAATFTNIIVGYEFESGTATIVDVSGRTLQQFSISSRTVPVDLSQYPNGVYIVNIKTNVQNDGVKVIKKGSN